MKLIKQTILAASIAAGLGMAGSAFALAFNSGPILFDRDGAGGATAPISVNNFTWIPNTVLADNLWTTTKTALGTTQTPTDFNMYSQGALGSFATNTGPGTPFCSAPGTCGVVPGTEFTFQFQSGMAHTASTNTGPDRVNAGLNPLSTTVPLFKIWYDTTPESQTAANILSGTGYGDNMAVLNCDKAANDAAATDGSRLVFCGTIIDAAQTFTQNTNAQGNPAEPPHQRLDSSGGDDYPAIGTITGLGSYNVDVETVYQDFAFFTKSMVALLVDVNHNGTNNLQFTQVSPSARVVGQTWDVGTDTGAMVVPPGGNRRINDLNCRNTGPGTPNGSTTCDMVYQGLPTTSFAFQAPEPGSLAMLGLGLGLLGFAGRRAGRRG